MPLVNVLFFVVLFFITIFCISLYFTLYYKNIYLRYRKINSSQIILLKEQEKIIVRYQLLCEKINKKLSCECKFNDESQ